jgi:hypothetical protein
LKESLEPLEDFVPGTMAPHGQNVDQFLDLQDHLFQALVLEHQQPDAASARVLHRHAKDSLNVERTPREQIADVAHYAWVVIHFQLQHDLCKTGLLQGFGNLLDHGLQPPIISVFAAPGGTMG